ncbi:MAG TPA: polysaccharide deacetylase family protein [Bryobacteraceae bacterium]|nr:polysaccharide deacetylase family protein [Bryobacteraceae bacterium]
MRPKWHLGLITIILVVFAAIAGWFSLRRTREDREIRAQLQVITSDYRRIIVLMDRADGLDAALRARCRTAGRRIFRDKVSAMENLMRTLVSQPSHVRQVINYVNSAGLRDADRLAFLDTFEELADTPRPSTAVKAELDDLHSIQNAYREEVTRIFSQFATRGGRTAREKWDSYVAWLRMSDSRDKILAQYDDGTTDEAESGLRGKENPNEISGAGFAPKTVALTFDDGPHPRYTEQVTALLRKYGIRACFFEVGQNLGKVGENGVTLLRTAEISKRVEDAGHVVANHTYSHRVLSKLSEEERTKEIEDTSTLLEKALGHKPLLFRPPYGARNQQVLDQITHEGLENIMWTVDSEDWADPIPESIAMRVLHQLDTSHKGIILFHDIHKQSVLALPIVLDELVRQEYTFLAFKDGKFEKSEAPLGEDRADNTPPPAPTQTAAGEKLNPYRESRAVIIGVNDYQNWPKLRYAVNDANAIEQTLVNRFGFRPENIRKLLNGEATRQRIMQVLGDELTDPAKVSRDDRVFFFFAGHGATRTLADNRQIGFIIPVDADLNNYYSTAISMTELREASDLIPAKHVYFVMDSCYSGLALTRGGASAGGRSYLEEVTSRVARQILTAGGADQLVADDGPGGHSVFTWALLEGLDGKADLDHNGVITASELGAYVSPIVASFSHQTPAMGNLIGSEGGEFVFELRPEALTSMTQQMEGKSLELTGQLATLEHQIAEKQAELLRLQQSIQAVTETTKQPAPTATQIATAATETPATLPPKARAYDLDRLARQLYREKKYDDAAHALERAVALKPGDPVLLNNLGFMYYEMGRYNDAIIWLEKTLAVDPNRKEAHGNIGYAYFKLGRMAEAKTHFDRYLALFPDSPEASEIRDLLASLQK